MKWIIIIILLPSTLYAGNWDKTDKALLTSKLTLHAIDMLQTKDIYDDDYREINPIISSGVGAVGEKFIPIYFVTTGILNYVVADYLDEYRKPFLAGSNAVSLVLVLHNRSIGLGLNFKF